jgi:DNA polymerase III subunit epsilon
MSWWQRLFRKRPQLEPTQRARLEHYVRLAKPDLKHSFKAMRFVVVDVESTGLRPYRDHLIAIGAVPVEENLVHLERGFEVVLRQAKPSANGNILVHGIDGTTQTSGRDPVEALIEFLEYARKDLLVGFHANFDRVMIARAARQALGIEPENPWLDLAVLAPELLPEQARGASTLDHWTERLGIENPARHNAVADALVTAQLLQVTLAAARQRGLNQGADLVDIERAGRWLEAHR